MTLLNNKWLSVVIGAALLALSSTVASAAAPNVVGYVKNKDTNEGIPGMVVKWEDSAAAKPDQSENGVRYTVTGADGKFIFPSWHLPPQQGGIGTDDLREREHDTEIDINYDGNTDVDKVSEDEGLYFGCGENPHTFTLMLPRPGYDGQFEPPKLVANLINGNAEQNVGTFYYTPTTPRCPGNIRHSCDATNTSATVTWDAPGGGATGYRLYYDKAPLGVLSAGDTTHPDLSNTLSRTFNVTPNIDYLVRLKTLRKDASGVERESESCLMQFKCENKPDEPGCTNGCCPGQICPCQGPNCLPSATLVSCANPTDQYYAYTISNINTYGLSFFESRLMLSFSLNAQNQMILDYLSGRNNSSTADFSLWNERKRPKQVGDYFGFYIQVFNSLPGSTLPYQIGPNTRIGQRTMAEFRQFLIANNLPLQHSIKANMASRNSDGAILFNSHIPAAQPIDLSKEFTALCETGTCPPGQVCDPTECPTITITQPAENEVLTIVDNKVTVQWTSAGAQPNTQYEVLIYDKTAYSSPDQAYQAYLVGVAVPIAMPNNLIVYTTTGSSQVVDFGHIDGMDPANWMIAIRAKIITVTGPCAWVTREPAPPGFPVSGTVYRYNPACQPLEVVPIGGTITATGGYSIPVINGEFNSSLPDTGTNYALQLALNDDTFSCANICGQGPSCVRDNINPGNKTAIFFVKEEDIFTKSWWQVFGGHVFAANTINSELPITDDNQSWRLMAQFLPGIAESAGIPITNRNRFGNDAPDNTNVAGWLREPPLQAPSAAVADSIKPDFTYYREKLGLPDTRLEGTINQTSQLNGQNKSGVVVHYREGDLKFAPNDTWDNSGHHVVLVQGNITISAENLTATDSVVATNKGDTKTFVASGNIIIEGNVGNSNLDSLASNLAGIFIGNQIIIRDGEEKRFVGEGSFIGWSNVLLERHFDDFALNENTPAETFLARPDFVVNLPEAIKDTSITWEEVN